MSSESVINVIVNEPSNDYLNFFPKKRISLVSFTSITLDHIGDQQTEDDGSDHPNASNCSDRTKKITKGLVLTIFISFAWVGTLHLLKLCYEFRSNKLIIGNYHSKDNSTPTSFNQTPSSTQVSSSFSHLFDCC